MAWEVTIRGADGDALGDEAAVRSWLNAAVPDLQRCREPSGAEAVAAARARGMEYPPALREVLETVPSQSVARVEQGDLSMQLYGFDHETIRAIHVEVRGRGDPIPILAAICGPRGWLAVDDSSGRPVELGDASTSGWEAFQAYRAHALAAMGRGEPEV